MKRTFSSIRDRLDKEEDVVTWEWLTKISSHLPPKHNETLLNEIA